MPNRDEIAIPSRRLNTRVVAAPGDAWPVAAFCAFGALMSIYLASAMQLFG